MCAYTPKVRYKATDADFGCNRSWISDDAVGESSFIEGKAQNEDISNLQCFSAANDLHIDFLSI
jgi:hypothetical protein